MTNAMITDYIFLFGRKIMLKLTEMFDKVNLTLLSDKNPLQKFYLVRFRIYLMVRGMLLEYFPTNTINFFLLLTSVLTIQSQLFIHKHEFMGFMLFLVPLQFESVSIAMVKFLKRNPEVERMVTLNVPMSFFGYSISGGFGCPGKKGGEDPFGVRMIKRALQKLDPSSAIYVIATAVVGGTAWMFHESFEHQQDRKAAAFQADLDRKAAENQADLDRKAAENQADLDGKAAENQAELNRKNTNRTVAWTVKNSPGYDSLAESQKNSVNRTLETGELQ